MAQETCFLCQVVVMLGCLSPILCPLRFLSQRNMWFTELHLTLPDRPQPPTGPAQLQPFLSRFLPSLCARLGQHTLCILIKTILSHFYVLVRCNPGDGCLHVSWPCSDMYGCFVLSSSACVRGLNPPSKAESPEESWQLHERHTWTSHLTVA